MQKQLVVSVHVRKKTSIPALIFFAGLFLISSNAFGFDLLISTIDEVGAEPFPRNGEVTYTIDTQNQQSDIAPGVVMTFPIPADTVYVSHDDGSSGECSYQTGPARVECNYGDLLGTNVTPSGPVKNVLVTIQATIPPGTYTFDAAASVAPTASDTNTPNNTATQNTTISDAADLTTTLIANPTTATAGGDVVYTATVTNYGPNDAVNNIDVIFQLSPNVTYSSSSGSNWSCSYSAGPHQISCTRTADLASGDPAPDITFTARVSGVTGTVTTTATIPPHADDPNPNNNVTTNDVTVTPGTDVAVTISASPSSVTENPTPGDNNTTTITILPRNNGPYDAEDVVVTYTIPTGFTIDTSPTGTGWTCDDTTSLPDVICTRTSGTAYTPGSTDDISLILRVPAWSGTSTFANPVTITTTAEAAERLANNSDSTNVTLIQAGVDLGLTKTKSPSLVMQGNQITSTLRVHNYGPLDFDPVSETLTLTDTLNVGQEDYDSYSGTDWTCSYSLGVVTCTYDAVLANGADSSYLYIYTTATATGLSSTGITTLTNTGAVIYSGSPADTNSGNNSSNASVTVTSRSADLTVTKSASPGLIAWNANSITYTIDICNNGPDAATGITLVDPIAGFYNGAVGTTGVSVTSKPPNYTCSGTSTITCTQNSGSRAVTTTDCTSPNAIDVDSFTIEVSRPLYDGNRTNTATVSTNEVIDSTPANNSDSATVTIDPLTDMRVQNKTVTPNPVKSGVEATYVITIINDGPSAAANVEVTDIFTLDSSDTGFTFVSLSASDSGDCSTTTYPGNMATGNNYTNADSLTLTCQWGSIPYNGTRTITMVVRPSYMAVSDPYTREFNNSVTVTTDTEDSNSGNDLFGPVTLTIERDEIDLLINNNDTPDPLGHDPSIPPGAAANLANDVVYHVDYRNNGPSLATGVNFVFTMTPKTGKDVQFLCDEADSGDSCTTSTDTCTITGGSNPVTGPATLTLSCPQNDLVTTASGDRYLSFRVISEPDPTGDTHNTDAVISANEFESIMGNNDEAEATSVRGKVDLEISKTSTPSTVDQTQAFDWVITVTNNGPSSSRNTVLTDDLNGFSIYDESISWVKTRDSLPDETGTCSLSGSDLTCDFGTIEATHIATVTIPVKVDSGSGSIQNCASVTTDDVDSNASNSTNVCGTVTVNNNYHPSDYGDAPDTDNSTGTGNYETLLNYGGARHYLDLVSAPNTPYLGTCVDADGAGNLQNANADADNVSGALNPPASTVIGTCGSNGDEDGVQIPVLVAGNTIDLQVTVDGADCNLSGWVDFNQDGDWTDAGEQVITDRFLDIATGTHTVPVTIPSLASISVGSSYARFRCATETGLTPTDSADPLHPDYALDGEVEDYLVSLQPENSATPVDYGDAPNAIYPTILASDGPSHILGVGGPILGNCVDSDTGSQENTAADADDSAGGGTTVGTCTVPNDDEDGINFPLLYADQNADLTITISDAACRLNGWIDFNNDGDWGDAGEQIFTNTSLGVGNHTRTIAIPNDVAVGNSYARFRCSSSSNNLGPIGAAADGEVEDYQIELLGYIKGQVRMDADDDADMSDTDAAIPGVFINLLDADNANALLATTTTDSNGDYEFLGLSAGNYTVEELDPADHVSTNDIDSANDNFIAVTLGNGGSSVGNDFIDTHLSSLGDIVWFDMNQNGIQDIDEKGITGVSVNLYKIPDTTTPHSTTTTDGVGFYEFTDLRTGDFLVEFIQPAGYSFSAMDQGANDAFDSDSNTATGRTPNITLPAGTRNETIDAGMYLTNGDLPARLSNLVWYDTSNDGIQDAGEPGVAGVTVNLFNGSGTPLAATSTNGLGIYEFTGLAAGDYVVEFIKPAGYTASVASAGSDATKDSDADTATGTTEIITLVAGENNPDIDAGIYITAQAPASLGDLVWYDTDQDGVQDAGEPGVGNITVSLFSAGAPTTVIATTITNADGAYTFNGLAAGNYIVHFELPDNQYLFSQTGAGTTATDSNADRITGRSGTITLTAGDNNPTIDAGIYLFSITAINIGDLVWLDTDYDNTPDGGEGILGVELILFDLHGKELQKTTTDASGNYLFIGYPPTEDFHVRVITSTLPADVYQIADPDSTYDSAHTALNVPADLLTVDFGYGYNNIIGDYVWFDENQDGIQEPAESGIAGVTVNLLNDSATQIDTTITDGNGYYEFSQLAAADYQVEFVAPTGYLFTTADQGSGALQDSFDSDADTGNGRTPLFTLGHNGINRTLDAGMYLNNNAEPAGLGNIVWFDFDKNGIQDPGEDGVSGATVKLWDAGYSTQISSTVTDGSGFYSFNGLPAGSYGVEFVLPAAFSFSPADQSDDASDSDADTGTGRTPTVTLTPGEYNPDIDAGLFFTFKSEEHPASLGDRVWYDTNKNGIQDGGEAGYGGVTVYLYSALNLITPISSTITDNSGHYIFTGLLAGDYRVKFETPMGQVLSPQGAGTPATNSDADPVSGLSATVILADEEQNLTIDAGVSGPEGVLYTIGDLVWLDSNHNGMPDNGEGLPNIDVVLYPAFGGAEILSTTTDANGIYGFIGVAAGDYRVAVDVSTLPLDTTTNPVDQLIQLADPDGVFDSSHQLIGFNTSTDLVDFGYREREVDVELDKTFVHTSDVDNNTKINTGDILTFTITVVNQSTDTATGVEVTDQLPKGYILGAVTTSQGSYSEPVWTIGTLTMGATVTLSMDATVTRIGDYLNTAEVTATSEYDIDSTPDNHIVEEDDQASVRPNVQNFPWAFLSAIIRPCPPVPDYCYLVADGDNITSTNSPLFKYTFPTDSLEMLNRLGVDNVETITLSLDGKTLYGADNGVFGIIDPTPGIENAFTPIEPAGVGLAGGALGVIDIDDIDGLSFDPKTGILYGSVRYGDGMAGELDLLIQINPESGRIIEDAFGLGVDYVVINTAAEGASDVDDIAIDSDGTLFGIAGNSGGGGGDHLVIINKQTGAVGDYGPLNQHGAPIQDMESLTLYNTRVLYGTTGYEFTSEGTDNILYKIDKASGETVPVTNLGKDFDGYVPKDFEAISCFPICK